LGNTQALENRALKMNKLGLSYTKVPVFVVIYTYKAPV
jgi:hypothetical protein